MILLLLSNIYIEHKLIKNIKPWDADVKTNLTSKHKHKLNKLNNNKTMSLLKLR